MYKIIIYNDAMKEEVVKLILSVLEGEFNHFGVDRPDLKNISAVYQKNDGNFWVVFDQDKLIGTIGLMNYDSGRGYIKRMCVAPDYRGKGVAQELLSTLLKFAKLHSFKELYLATSPGMVAAQRFYEKEGFEKISELPKDFPTSGATIFYKLSLD